MLVAEVAEIVEEIAGEQADADAQLQHEDVVFQRCRFLRFDQVGEEDLGGVRDRVPSLLMTNGTGEASLMNALLPRSRRYCWPSSHSSDSAKRTEILHNVARGLSLLQ